jgi:hypothetical protein
MGAAGMGAACSLPRQSCACAATCSSTLNAAAPLRVRRLGAPAGALWCAVRCDLPRQQLGVLCQQCQQRCVPTQGAPSCRLPPR